MWAISIKFSYLLVLGKPNSKWTLMYFFAWLLIDFGLYYLRPSLYICSFIYLVCHIVLYLLHVVFCLSYGLYIRDVPSKFIPVASKFMCISKFLNKERYIILLCFKLHIIINSSSFIKYLATLVLNSSLLYYISN